MRKVIWIGKHHPSNRNTEGYYTTGRSVTDFDGSKYYGFGDKMHQIGNEAPQNERVISKNKHFQNKMCLLL